MKIQKKVSINGDWVKVGEEIKDGDMIKIKDEGRTVESKFGDQQVFKIGLKTGEERIMSFNQTSLNNLIDAYGDETKNWVDKKAKVYIIKQMVSGGMKNVVYLVGENWRMLEDGQVIKAEAPTPSGMPDDTNEIPF